MHVANRELCKELYELSEWITEYKTSRWEEDGNSIGGFVEVPAYDLGYLLRKLPERVDSNKYPGNKAVLRVGHNGPWFLWYHVLGVQDVESDFGISADTPEDAACEIAIELFKQGVLTNAGQKEQE